MDDLLFRRVPVLASWDETPSFRGVRVQLTADMATHHGAPGQIVKLRTVAGEGYFALASTPTAEAVAELLLKRGGKIADLAINAASTEAALEMSAPFGKGFPIAPAIGRDVLLFAAGSGIAPIRSLIQYFLAHRGDFGTIVLYYGQRHGADFAYRGESDSWEGQGIRVYHCTSGKGEGWRGVSGRVQDAARDSRLSGLPAGDLVAYVCGMHAMIADVHAMLVKTGVPPENIYVNF